MQTKRKHITGKLKGFTLLELLFVMIVTGIVFTVGYQAYGLVSRQYMDFRDFNNEVSRMTLLHTALSKDLSAASTVREVGNRIECYDYDNEVTSYAFEFEGVVRTHKMVSDTFPCTVSAMQTDEIRLPRGAGALVSAVYFEASMYGINYPYHYRKHYGKEVLMRLENDQ